MRKTTTTRPGRWLLLALMTSIAASWTSAQTAPPTQVVNVASVNYTTGAGNVRTDSNAVVTPTASIPGLRVTKSVQPAGPVPPGTQVTFRFMVENPAASPVTGVVITDPLDPLLGVPVSVSTGPVANRSPSGGTITVAGIYAPSTHSVRWDAAVVPSGARFELSFSTQVSAAAPDDSIVRNVTAQVSVQDPNGTASNEVLVPVVAPALSIAKQASRSRADVGDPIGFTIDVANISATLDLTTARVRDLMPRGFRYLENSAMLDGRKAPDPAARGGGRELLFSIGDLPRGGVSHLTYVAVTTAEAEDRESLNKAWVEAETPAGSTVGAGPAEARVRVSGSLLDGEAVIVGRVFVDDNRNGLFDQGEVGVPQARVYLEDGTFTLTDVVGKYHIEGVRPGLHVAKIDRTTLPEGLGSVASWSRSAGGAGTQFVDTGDDQLFKTNIATTGWGIAVSRFRITGHYRRPAGASSDLSEESAVDSGLVDWEDLRVVRFPPLLSSAIFEKDGTNMMRAARAVVEGYASLIRERGSGLVGVDVEPAYYPASDEGLMRARAERFKSKIDHLVLASIPKQPGRGDDTRASAEATPDASLLVPASAREREPEMTSLEARVREMTSEPAVLLPAENVTLLTERANVEVTLPSGLEPRVTVNGQIVANDAIAVRMETSLTHVVFYRYLGLPFNEGRNSIVLEGVDQWGNARAWVERIVNRVGPPRHIALRPDAASLSADARTPVPVKVEVRDALGLPVSDGTLVTLEVDEGQFLGTDAAPREEGFQVATVSGEAIAHLSPASRAGQRTLTAAAGEATSESSFSLAPEVRQWIVAGVGEGTLGRRGMGSGASLSETLGDPAADARLALFARGRLFSSSLMTLAYDSSRERDRDQVFRRIAPDRYFPIYGDSSEQGYEVESQGRFSLRLDQPRSTLTLGDFTTGLAGGDLLRYDRALTGGSGRLHIKGFTMQSFGATTPQTQVRDDLPGAGISGPYRLSRRPVVINSEHVVVETRDRFHPERVLATRSMSRFSDYDIDYEGGSLLFKQPIPFQDDDFNAVVAVVIYETLDGNGESTVAGGRVGYHFGETAEVGTTYVNESRDGGDFVMRGADFQVQRSFGLSSMELKGSAATTESGGSNSAGAVSFSAAGKLRRSVGLSGYYRNVAEGFSNPSRTGIPDSGTVRWGFAGDATLPDTSRLKGEYFSQTDSLRGQDRRVGAVDWERVIGKVTARSGFKDLSAIDPLSGEKASSRLVAAGIGLRLSRRFEATLGRQQVVSGAALQEYPTRSSLGLATQMTDDVRAFLRQEYDQSDAGDTSRTVVGMESRLTRHAVMESRYSLEDALSGSRGYAQLGLRTQLPLSQDWLGSASLERVETTSGPTSGDFTALGLGFEYLPAKVKLTTRYELRLGDQEDTHVLTAGGATRITDALSLFGRNRLYFVNPGAGGSRFDGDGLLGLAYRPVSNDRLNFLVKLQGVKGNGVGGAGSAGARSYLAIFETNYQPVGRLHLMGRLAYKQSRDLLEGTLYRSGQSLGETRILYDITARFSAGATFRLLDQPAAGAVTRGYGAEGGYQIARDLWMVAGYNVTGFSTVGFGDTDRRTAGPFLTLRFKFDEESLIGLSRGLQARRGEEFKRTPPVDPLKAPMP